MKGLTWGKETCRILIGGFPKLSTTRDGKVKLKFDGAFGITDIERLSFCTWRHCIAYGEIAESIKDIKKGDLVEVFGPIFTEVEKDSSQNPVMLNGQYKTRQIMICYSAKIIPKEEWKKTEQLPLEAGQAV